MQFILVLVGCCGCGKDFISKLLMLAYPQFCMVSTSRILEGGNNDGSMVRNDLMVQIMLENYLESNGFFDFEKSGHFIFNGAGRNRTQMSSLIGMFCENGMLTENARFVKLNITSQEAYRRMVARYHENLMTSNLRNEEVGDYDVVLKRFRSRIAEWQKTRDGIFDSMSLNLNGHKSPIIDINAEKTPAVVAIEIVDELGLDRNAMIDVLVNNGLDMTGVPGFKKPERSKVAREKSEQQIAVAVQ